MRIAGVSIDEKNPPKREQIFKMAMRTKEYIDNPFAEKEINDALEQSGLWKIAKTEDNGLHSGIAKKHSKRKR